MPLTQSSISLELIRLPVTATVAGAPYDPTGDTVQMAFVAVGVTPGGGDWKLASWEMIDLVPYAICLVGPGGAATPGVGTYEVWIKVTDDPEIPARKVDTLTIT